MILEGCQGNKGVQIREQRCPNCGNMVELMSTDLFAECEVCGTVVYSDLMTCVHRCPKARECVGEAMYNRLMEARAQLQLPPEDNDQW